MSERFNKVPIAVQNRGRRNLSATTHLTSDFGRMDCVYHTELVPGENVNLKIDSFLRSAPMPAPTFGEIDIDHRVFFVPYRILCNLDKNSLNGEFSWDDYITGRSSVSHPYMSLTTIIQLLYVWYHNSNPDSSVLKARAVEMARVLSCLGIPSVYLNSIFGDTVPVALHNQVDRINPFCLAAYQQIWWDYYRDSQQIDESVIRDYIPVLTAGNNLDSVSHFLIPRYACFRKDYFNTSKRHAQAGPVSVSAGTASYDEINTIMPSSDNVEDEFGSIVNPAGDNGVPIQWLRAANSLQKYLERNNLAGSRLMERFLARFGVSPSYVALNMSEYLGGNRSRVQIGDITANNEDGQTGASRPTNAFNTYGEDVGTMQGQLGGKSVADNSTGNITFRAKEFGVLLSLIHI